MIQRKQTLFLLLVVLSGIALLFIPSNSVALQGSSTNISLLPFSSAEYTPSVWHMTGIGLNFVTMGLSLLTIFLFKNRNLQIKLCYLLMLLELALTLIISFCPLVIKAEGLVVESSGFGSLIGIIGMMTAYLAAYYIKKDIELLKSADRIR